MNVFNEAFVDDKIFVETIIQDCKLCFDVRHLKSSSENYSTGSTYFIKADENPLNNLESIAFQIFKIHTKDIAYDAENSGAEWWTQVIDSRDDIGFHWDRDYGIEEQSSKHIYPLFATVTYLSNVGGPTMILNCEGSSETDKDFAREINSFFVCKPEMFKHIYFNGKLLHAASSDILDMTSSDDDSTESEESVTNINDGRTLRITFLVNIWINHIPIQSKRFPEKNKKNKNAVSSKYCNSDIVVVNGSVDDAMKVKCKRKKVLLNNINENYRTLEWKFNNSDCNYKVLMPICNANEVIEDFKNYDIIDYEYHNTGDISNKFGITIANCDSSSESENDDDSDDSVEDKKSVVESADVDSNNGEKSSCNAEVKIRKSKRLDESNRNDDIKVVKRKT